MGRDVLPPGTASADRRDWYFLILLWAAVTACNLFKPYHIDDTAYLEIARWIGSHPLHPMVGPLNWEGANLPIYKTLHPHLFLYLLAGWMKLFGSSEPATHALQSLNAFACIALMYRLAQTLAPSLALWLTALLALGPAFVVEQNLMIDLPLLATWLLFFYCLICRLHSSRQSRRYLIAALACGAAILIKYSSLVLLPVLCGSLLLERRVKQFWTVSIPILILAAWSLFNLFDYGHIHLLGTLGESERPPHSFGEFAITWVVALGSLCGLGPVVFVQSRPRLARAAWVVYLAVSAAFLALAAAVVFARLTPRQSNIFLQRFFVLNGLLILIPLMLDAWNLAQQRIWRREETLNAAPRLYLLVWIAAASLFYIAFAPFIAARHVLTIVPPVLLLLGMRWGTVTSASKLFALMTTVIVSAALCISDWRFADFYRSEAAALSHKLQSSPDQPGKPIVWASGHWGWQWYARSDGLNLIDRHSSPVRPGDILIVPREVPHEFPDKTLGFTLIQSDTESHPLLNLFCTGDPVRFYHTPNRLGSWSLSRDCLNHVDVFRAEAPQ